MTGRARKRVAGILSGPADRDRGGRIVDGDRARDLRGERQGDGAHVLDGRIHGDRVGPGRRQRRRWIETPASRADRRGGELRPVRFPERDGGRGDRHARQAETHPLPGRATKRIARIAPDRRDRRGRRRAVEIQGAGEIRHQRERDGAGIRPRRIDDNRVGAGRGQRAGWFEPTAARADGRGPSQRGPVRLEHGHRAGGDRDSGQTEAQPLAARAGERIARPLTRLRETQRDGGPIERDGPGHGRRERQRHAAGRQPRRIHDNRVGAGGGQGRGWIETAATRPDRGGGQRRPIRVQQRDGTGTDRDGGQAEIDPLPRRATERVAGPLPRHGETGRDGGPIDGDAPRDIGLIVEREDHIAGEGLGRIDNDGVGPGRRQNLTIDCPTTGTERRGRHQVRPVWVDDGHREGGHRDGGHPKTDGVPRRATERIAGILADPADRDRNRRAAGGDRARQLGRDGDGDVAGIDADGIQHDRIGAGQRQGAKIKTPAGGAEGRHGNGHADAIRAIGGRREQRHGHRVEAHTDPLPGGAIEHHQSGLVGRRDRCHDGCPIDRDASGVLHIGGHDPRWSDIQLGATCRRPSQRRDRERSGLRGARHRHGEAGARGGRDRAHGRRKAYPVIERGRIIVRAGEGHSRTGVGHGRCKTGQRRGATADGKGGGAGRRVGPHSHTDCASGRPTRHRRSQDGRRGGEHGRGRAVELYGIGTRRGTEARTVEGDGGSNRTRGGRELQHSECRGWLSGDAGQIPHTVVGVDRGVTRRIDDGAQAARVVVDIADIRCQPGKDEKER